MKKYAKKTFKKLKGLDFWDTFKNSSVYFMSQILIQGLGIVSLGVYTSFLEPEDYGLSNGFLSIANIAVVLFSLNLPSTISRYYFEEKQDVRQYVGSTLTVLLSVLALVVIITTLFHIPLFEALNLPPQTFPFLCVFAVGEILSQVLYQLLFAEKKSLRYTIIVVATAYLKFGLGVAFIIYYSRGTGKIMGDSLAYVLMLPVIIYYLWKWFVPSLNREHIKYMFAIAIPLLPYSASHIILNSLDQIMINAQAGTSDGGLYAFAYKAGGLLMTGVNVALVNASNPDFFKWMNASNYGAVRNQIGSMLKLQTLAGLGIALFAVDMAYFLATKEKYHTALYIIPIIVGGYFLLGLFQLFGRYMFYHKNMLAISILTIISAVINAVLNLIFIPRYGYMAAAWTTLVSYMALLIMVWITCRYIYKIKEIPEKAIADKLVFGAIIIAAAGYLNRNGFAWEMMIPKIVLFGAVALWLFRNQWNRFVKSR